VELCSGACAASSKPKPAEWQISKIGKVARYIGTVQAADAKTAIKLAIQKYDIPSEYQDRIAARQIVLR